MGWNSCEIITGRACSGSAGSIMLWTARASSSSSSLSFSRACSSSGGAVVCIRLAEGGAFHRRGKIGGKQESNRAAAIQGENGRRCFLTHLVVRFSCGRPRPGTHFFHALSRRRSDRCCSSLCRLSLLFEENAGNGSRYPPNAGLQPTRRSKRPPPARPGGTRLHTHR